MKVGYLIFPIKIGDEVWCVQKSLTSGKYFVYNLIVEYINITKFEIKFGRKGSGMVPEVEYGIRDIGRKVFLLEKRAEIVSNKLNNMMLMAEFER